MLEQKRKSGDNHLYEIKKLNERMEQLNKKNINVKVKKRLRVKNKKNTILKGLRYKIVNFLGILVSNMIDFTLILAIYYPFRNTIKDYYFLLVAISYFCIFDGIIGWSIGKKILGLEVVKTEETKER